MKKILLIIAALTSAVGFVSCTKKAVERGNTQRDETTRREAARSFDELEDETRR